MDIEDELGTFGKTEIQFRNSLVEVEDSKEFADSNGVYGKHTREYCFVDVVTIGNTPPILMKVLHALNAIQVCCATPNSRWAMWYCADEVVHTHHR